jgi:hypothetical protein
MGLTKELEKKSTQRKAVSWLACERKKKSWNMVGYVKIGTIESKAIWAYKHKYNVDNFECHSTAIRKIIHLTDLIHIQKVDYIYLNVKTVKYISRAHRKNIYNTGWRTHKDNKIK